MDIVLITSLLAVGGFVGFLAGLLGIGGGMTMVPFMVMLFEARDFPPGELIKIAIATSLAVNLFTSVSSARAHYRHGAVRTDLLWAMAGVRSWAPSWGECCGRLEGFVLGRLLCPVRGLFGLADAQGQEAQARPRCARPSGPWPGGLRHRIHLKPARRWRWVSDHSLSHLVQCFNAPCGGDIRGPGFPIALGGWWATFWLASRCESAVGSVGYIYLPALASWRVRR